MVTNLPWNISVWDTIALVQYIKVFANDLLSSSNGNSTLTMET